MKTSNYLFIVALITLAACNSEDIVCEAADIITPIENCDTGLLLMRSDGDTGEPRFSLDTISKPVVLPLLFQNIRQDQQDDTQFDIFNRPSNYDAFNANTNTYFIEFPFQQRLYKYDINTQTRQELIVSGFYSAPVFGNNTLYTITIDNFGNASNPANYSIDTINTNDGSLTTLTTNSFPLLSSFNWESMSSASNNSMIYFISGTNLISYDIANMTSQHIQLVPDFDPPNNFQQFFGLEMRNNGNLLAIRKRDNNQGEGLELVEIDITNPTADPTVMFDFMANTIDLNSEFYSTTYDACDDTYYVTSRNNIDTTSFYEINVTGSTLLTENFDFYLMGIQTKNN